MEYRNTGRGASPRNAREALADIPRQIAALRCMSGGELKATYIEVYGEPSRSNNVDYLRKKIAWRIQELAEGGLSECAMAKVAEIGKDVPIRVRPTPAIKAAVAAMMAEPVQTTHTTKPRDPRLPPPGSILRRTHQGVEHEIIVHESDFEYRGQRYRSLSKIAREITGTPWNGLLFFGLTIRKSMKKISR